MSRFEKSPVAEESGAEWCLMERLWEGGIDLIIERSGCLDM